MSAQTIDLSRPLAGDRFLAGGVTFSALFAHAAELGGRLASAAGPDTPVCLAAEDKGVVAAAVISAAFGAPRLVLPHAFGARVLEEVARDTGATAVLTDAERDLPDAMPRVTGADLFSGQTPDSTARGANILRDLFPAGPRAADDTMLLLYTGGTTGTPRVWPKTVRNLFAEAAYLAEVFEVTRGDTILSTVPSNHIYGLLFSIFLPLVSGARVVGEMPYFPQEVAEAARRDGASILVSSPLHYKALMTTPLKGCRFRVGFSSGGFLGEAAGAAFHRHTAAPVVEVYGSTESGGVATRCRARGELSWTPFDSVRWRISDERLLVSSAYVSPGLTTQEDGFFRTGDRVSPAGPGRFNLLGRADGVVQVAGQRVDLGDVTRRIESIDGVTDVFVFSVAVGMGRENEVAALVESSLTEETLRRLLREKLDAPALPRHLRVVDTIPTTPVGKRDAVLARTLLGLANEPGSAAD